MIKKKTLKPISSVEIKGKVRKILFGPSRQFLGISVENQGTLFYKISGGQIIPCNFPLNEIIKDFIFMNSDKGLKLVYLNSQGGLRVFDLSTNQFDYVDQVVSVKSLGYLDPNDVFIISESIEFGVFSLATYSFGNLLNLGHQPQELNQNVYQTNGNNLKSFNFKNS
jgi:hypothetical protein